MLNIIIVKSFKMENILLDVLDVELEGIRLVLLGKMQALLPPVNPFLEMNSVLRR